MQKKFENVKGTYDYLPEKQVVRERIRTVLQRVFVKYGFLPIETPILCKYDLLASKYSEGADILNEMYKLKDQGRRELGLRYDLTITFSKPHRGQAHSIPISSIFLSPLLKCLYYSIIRRRSQALFSCY